MELPKPSTKEKGKERTNFFPTVENEYSYSGMVDLSTMHKRFEALKVIE